MRYINTDKKSVTFIDVDGKVKVVSLNQVWYRIKDDTITFLLVDRYGSEGICIFTTMAEDLQINGKTYTIEELKNGDGIGDLFGAVGITFKIVSILPSKGENGIIYLVPNSSGTHTEYIWLVDDDKWEILGDVANIDMTDYYRKGEVDAIFATQTVVNAEIAARIEAIRDINTSLQAKADKSDTYTKTQVDTALAAKVSQTEFDTKEEVISTALNELEENKQDKLTAGANITIDANNVISSTGGTQQQADWNQTDNTAVDYIKNKPTIPDTSEFVSKSEYNPKELAIAEALTDLNENKADKTEIPDVSTFATKTELNAKQDALVSGTNIKTINNQSILGEGNIEIQGGGGEQQQADWNQTDTTAVDYIKNKPTNVSAFTNDAGYLTQHQSLANYYTKTEIDAMVGNINTILASI